MIHPERGLRIERRGITEMVNGPYEVITEEQRQGNIIALLKAVDGTDKAQDISLMSYGIVYVPKPPIASPNTLVDPCTQKMLLFPLSSPIPMPAPSGYRGFGYS
jgi:hypothetical protein